MKIIICLSFILWSTALVAQNVGIGTTTPTLGKLVVNGKVGATVAVFDDNGTGISLQSNLPSIGYNEYYNAGSKFISTGFGGKLALLTASGDLAWYASSASGTAGTAMTLNQRLGLSRGGSMFVQGPDAGYVFVDRTSTNYGGWNWYANAGKASLFRYNQGGNTITIDSTGALGLQGVTNPTAPLSFASNTGNKITLWGDATGGHYGFGIQGSLMQIYSSANDADIAFGYGSSNTFSEKMRVKGNGNVGIGTNNPVSKLEIRGSTGEGLFVSSTLQSARLTTGALGVLIGSTSNNSTNLVSNDIIGATLKPDGNFGIGVVNPNYKLDVDGRMRLRQSGGLTPGIWFNNSSNAEASFIGQYKDDLWGVFGNAWQFAINRNDGTVYLGSPNLDNENFAKGAGYKLRVFGKIISEEVRVQLTSAWPDYVFEEGYKKLTLPELETYLKENKHLPNVPSAADIDKDGQQLGEIQRKMLEKIEELSLYVIELKKEIDVLKLKK